MRRFFFPPTASFFDSASLMHGHQILFNAAVHLPKTTGVSSSHARESALSKNSPLIAFPPPKICFVQLWREPQF